MTAKEMDIRSECYKEIANFTRSLEVCRDIAYREIEESKEREDYNSLYKSTVRRVAIDRVIAWISDNIDTL